MRPIVYSMTIPDSFVTVGPHIAFSFYLTVTAVKLNEIKHINMGPSSGSPVSDSFATNTSLAGYKSDPQPDYFLLYSPTKIHINQILSILYTYQHDEHLPCCNYPGAGDLCYQQGGDSPEYIYDSTQKKLRYYRRRCRLHAHATSQLLQREQHFRNVCPYRRQQLPTRKTICTTLLSPIDQSFASC